MTRVEQAALKYRQALHKEDETNELIAFFQRRLLERQHATKAALEEWKRIEREEAGE